MNAEKESERSLREPWREKEGWMRTKTESLRQSESKRGKELEWSEVQGMCQWNPGIELMSRWRFDMPTHLAVTSEKTSPNRTEWETSTLAKEDQAAGAEQPDKLRKTARFEQEASSAAASSDPTVALEYPASGETRSRPGSVLVQKSGHVDDDVQISALDAFYLWNGWTKESLHRRSVGMVSRRRCWRSRSVGKVAKIDESSMFPKSMADRKTPKQYVEIQELEANTIALKVPSTTRRDRSIMLRLDRSESLLLTFADNSGIVGGCEFVYRIPRNLKTRHLPTVWCRDKLSLVATFRVARVTLQTRKLWLVSRPTVTHVTFDLPECTEPWKNKKIWKETQARKKQEKWRETQVEKKGNMRKQNEKMKNEKNEKNENEKSKNSKKSKNMKNHIFFEKYQNQRQKKRLQGRGTSRDGSKKKKIVLWIATTSLKRILLAAMWPILQAVIFFESLSKISL